VLGTHAPAGLTRRDTVVFVSVTLLAAIAVALRLADVSPVVVFAAAGVAVAGLAWVLGVATEETGEVAGPRLSALLNATFGNAAELIIVVLAIRAGLVDVAKASIIGSVLGNMLLILGASLFVSGFRHGRQSFEPKLAGVNAAMLGLAAASIGLPTLFAATHPRDTGALGVSEGIAVIMLVVYAAYIYASLSSSSGRAAEGERRAARWSMRLSITVLALSAIGTGFMSEILVEAIEPTIRETGISRVFIGLIVIPLVGNIAEHLAAVRLAWLNQLDFAMGIAFNSALQVALAVSAIAVFAGVFTGESVTLVFTALEIALLVAASVIAGFVALSGTANWIEGVQLLSLYVIAGVLFWYA
jgi:Ca2+:H+ antiporter